MKKRVAIFCFCTTLIAAASRIFVPAALAEMNTLSGKTTLTYTKKEVVPVGDVEGHILQVGQSSGPNTNTGDWDFMSGATCGTRSSADIVRGNGTHAGYFICEKGEDKTVAKYQGLITTTMGPEGKPNTTFAGVWHYVKCAGTYAGCTGNGVYSGHFETPEVSIVEFRGTLAK